MSKLIHKKTQWSSTVERHKLLFRIRTLDVGRKGHLKVHVAFAKNDKARRLINGRSSVPISYLYPKSDMEQVKNMLKTRWGL